MILKYSDFINELKTFKKGSNSGSTKELTHIWEEDPHQKSKASLLMLNSELEKKEIEELFKNIKFLSNEEKLKLQNELSGDKKLSKLLVTLNNQQFLLDKQEEGELRCEYCDKGPLKVYEITPEDFMNVVDDNKINRRFNPMDGATCDHKNPKSKGGEPFDYSNLAVCCYKCNTKKSDMDYDTWMSSNWMRKVKKFEKFDHDIDAKDIPTFIKKYGVEDGEHPEIDKDLTKKILDSWGVKNYTINEDGSVDLDGSILISNYMLNHNNELPITFRNIQGSFSVYQCYLSTTKGFPKYVGGHFGCSYTGLTTLEGGPDFVGGNYNCSYNKLTTLKGIPRHIDGDFDCSHNYELKSLEGAPDSVRGNFSINSTKVTSLDGMPMCGGSLSLSQYIRQCEVNAYYDLLFLCTTSPEMVGSATLNKKVISSLKEFIDIHDDTDFALKTYKDKYYMDLEWVTPFEFDDIKRLLTERDIENEKRKFYKKRAPR